MARARAANTTPEEWLDQIVGERLEREDLYETTRVFSEEMRRKMVAGGVKPSDVEREIADDRREAVKVVADCNTYISGIAGIPIVRVREFLKLRPDVSIV